MADKLGGIGFTEKGKKRGADSLAHWWESPDETVAKDLTLYCQALELSQRPARFRSYAYHMVATGRAPVSYGLAMPGQNVSGDDFTYGGDLYNAEFTPPSENICAIAIDTFENKIWCQRPFLEWLAPNDDNYKLRRSCKEATSWADQIWSDLNVWDLVQAAGKDSGIVGTGWIFGRSLPGKVELIRLDDDCALIDPTAGENPRAWQIRLFMDRGDLIKQYANGEDKAKNQEIRDALQSAPGCRLGFFPMPAGYQDTIAICVGYYLKRGDENGKYVVAVDNVLLDSGEYTHEKPPLAKCVWQRISGSVRGKGPVETILPIQRELDRITDNVAEQERVCAWNRVQTRVGNNVDPDALSGNSILEYTLEPVKFEQGLPPPAQLYQRMKDLRNSGLFSVGITEAQVQGQSSPGVTASVAMQSEMQISDVRHRAVALNQEAFVEDLGDLLVRLAKDAKPSVTRNGKKIDFAEVERAVKGGKARAFPLSGLPQSIPGRQQEIENQYRAGQITKAQYQRLKGFPVTGSSNDEQTAPIDLIQWQMDEMIETGEFQVPLPFQDLVTAKDIASRRYQIEKTRRLSRDRLQLIALYMAQVDERLKEQPPPPAPMPAPQAAPMPPTAQAAPPMGVS